MNPSQAERYWTFRKKKSKSKPRFKDTKKKTPQYSISLKGALKKGQEAMKKICCHKPLAFEKTHLLEIKVVLKEMKPHDFPQNRSGGSQALRASISNFCALPLRSVLLLRNLASTCMQSMVPEIMDTFLWHLLIVRSMVT